MCLSAETVRLSDCRCILTSQLCSCCQTALHINATYVSEASFSSILINTSFIYDSEARQGSAGFAALGWLKPFVHFVSSPLPWSVRATPWVILPPDVTCIVHLTRIISGHCVFLSTLWERTSSSITGQLHKISHLFLMSADDQIVGCAYW